MMRNIFLIVICFNILYAVPKVKETTLLWENGIQKLKYSWYFHSKTQKKVYHGKWTDFYPDGHVKTQKEFGQGLLEGTVKSWDQKGVLRTSLVYENNVKHGLQQNYNPQGILIEECILHREIKNGLCRTFHENGGVKEITSWSMGKRNGIRRLSTQKVLSFLMQVTKMV